MSGIVVVYYSRYSKESLEFLEQVEQLMEVRKICVDNTDVRQQILDEEHNYKIRVVPSILVFHSNGFLEKQNGMECYEWLKSVTPKKQQELLPVMEVSKKQAEDKKEIEKKVSIDEIQFEPRKLETYPLVEKDESSSVEENKRIEEQIKDDKSVQAQNNVTKNNSNESIMTMAQQMQKQREMEDKTITSN
jgi:hypothetical protein